MTRTALTLTALLCSASAYAQGQHFNAKKQAADQALLDAMPKEPIDKECILAAAAKLPRIAGLEIKQSRAVRTPEWYKPVLGVYTLVVEIDARAAGQDVTYSFACAKEPRSPASADLAAQR